MSDKEEYVNQAKLLHKHLCQEFQNTEFSYGDALDCIAAINGFKNWDDLDNYSVWKHKVEVELARDFGII